MSIGVAQRSSEDPLIGKTAMNGAQPTDVEAAIQSTRGDQQGTAEEQSKCQICLPPWLLSPLAKTNSGFLLLSYRKRVMIPVGRLKGDLA